MDRSFLSQPAVIAASRNFICIRLTSYEDETEMQFCRSLFIGKSGDAENTTFTILSPDAREPLIRPHRSPKQVFPNAAAMAEVMNQLASRYAGKLDDAKLQLPITLDARLGLDVAASDGLPLIVVLGDESSQPVLQDEVAPLAWNRDYIGYFTYAIAFKPSDIPHVDGIAVQSGILLIEPDTFGQKGRIVKQLDANASPEQIGEAMRQTVAHHTKSTKSSRQHRADGIKQGAFWIPNLQVSDREERSARERTRREIESKKKEKSDHE